MRQQDGIMAAMVQTHLTLLLGSAIASGGIDCKREARTLASDSPNHMVSSSGPLTEMKFAWHSLAMALASSVLPQPAGSNRLVSL